MRLVLARTARWSTTRRRKAELRHQREARLARLTTDVWAEDGAGPQAAKVIRLGKALFVSVWPWPGRERQALVATSGLLTCLDDERFKAVIRHERAHVLNRDVRVHRKLAPLFFAERCVRVGAIGLLATSVGVPNPVGTFALQSLSPAFQGLGILPALAILSSASWTDRRTNLIGQSHSEPSLGERLVTLFRSHPPMSRRIATAEIIAEAGIARPSGVRYGTKHLQ